MKRIIALFLSMLMVLSLVPTAMAAGYKDITVSFSLTSEGENTIYAQPGDEITVNFSVINKTNAGESFTVETIYNDIKIDNNFFEIDNAKIESPIGLAYAHFQYDSSSKKWARFNGEHSQEPTGLRTYQSGEIVGTFKLTVKATEGQTTLESTDPWMTDEGNTAYHISTDNLTVIIGSEPATLYTVKYISEGEEVSTSQSAAGTITVGPAPNNGPENHQFMGWMNGGTLYQPGASFELSGDTTFTANWERIIPNYTLTFDTNGGTAVEKQTMPEGTVVNLTEFTTSKTGYTFGGWYSEADFKNNVTSITLIGNTTVYAMWIEESKPTYTLTFDTNGGSSITSVSTIEGTVVDLSTYKPTKTNYNFKGWYSDKELKNKVTSVTMDANKTVYADWEKKDSGGGSGGGGGGGGGGVSVNKYTITLKDTDGTDLKVLEYKDGTNVELKEFVFDKAGYTFDGWYTDKELTNKVTSIKVTKDTVLYANWTKTAKPGQHPGMLTTEHYAYIVGREGNRVEPMANITRAEVAVIFFRLLNEDVRKSSITRENTFGDVNEGDWFNTAVSTLANLGIITGKSQDVFDPAANITRAEFTTIAARFSDAKYEGEDLFSDIDGHWAQDYINRAASLGWVVGDNGIFRPNDNITRAEVMTLVNRVLNRVPESEADMLGEMTRWEDNADTNAWYYLAVQEATNSHEYEMKPDGIHEKWTKLTQSPDWAEFEK